MSELFIRCEIENGGFTSERTFLIQVNDGKLIGTANVDYLRTEDRKTLHDGHPGYGETINGFVACHVIKYIDQEDTALVELPSSDAIHVPSSELLQIN